MSGCASSRHDALEWAGDELVFAWMRQPLPDFGPVIDTEDRGGVAAALGIDLHHFGVVVVFNMMIGLITPPYGILLYIIKALNGIPLGEMIREVWALIALLIAVLLLITYVPETVLWLPRAAGLLH